MASLLIVDDHAAVRAGVTALVEREPGLTVAGQAADAESALEIARRQMPDLAVIDLHLPGEDGLSLCLRLDAAPHRPGLVLYSAFADDLLAVRATIAGADALVPKNSDPEELLTVLLATASGVQPPIASTATALGAVGASIDHEDLPILGMLVHGTSPAEVAATLGLTGAQLLARRWAILRRLSPQRERPAREAVAG
jgi:DNA-binding NarL/FixJ family response regulator